MKKSELYLSGYFTQGNVIHKTYGGKQYEIEQYQGKHANEYCVYEVKNGVRDGNAELYENGMVKMRWTMKDGVRDGRYVLLQKGRVVVEGRWSDIDNSEERTIPNQRRGSVMVIRVKGVIVYEGSYNEELQRDGLGYEYENGILARYGKWEKDRLTELKQLFVSQSEMIEYADGSTSDLLSHRPVYVGGYQMDEASGQMKRNGAGSVLNEETGICEYESEWENGIETESKRVALYDGWYHEHTARESVRQVVNGPVRIGDAILIDNPFQVEKLQVENNLYNQSNMTQLELICCPQLKQIAIGEACLGQVHSFSIGYMNELESITVQEESCTNCRCVNDLVTRCREEGSFRVSNCPKLKSIRISDFAFSDYTSIDLDKLPSLQSIEMGSFCFYSVSCFSVIG